MNVWWLSVESNYILRQYSPRFEDPLIFYYLSINYLRVIFSFFLTQVSTEDHKHNSIL